MRQIAVDSPGKVSNMSELSKLFSKMQKLSVEIQKNKSRFDEMIEEKYGYHYSDKDLDKIIDCLDYGNRSMTFKEFDKIMRENK